MDALTTTQDQQQTRSGRFFAGMTPAITTSVGDDVVAQLVNPAGSGKNVFVFAETLTMDVGGTFLHFFDATPSVALSTSTNVAVTNRNFADGTNVAQIRFAKAATITLTGGVQVFVRITPAFGETIRVDINGTVILDPGSNLTVFAANLKSGTVYVVFAWWEEAIVG